MGNGLHVVFIEDAYRGAQDSTLPHIFTSEDFSLNQHLAEDVDFGGRVRVPDVMVPFNFDWVSSLR